MDLKKIEMEMVYAGEQAVMNNLKSLGLLTPASGIELPEKKFRLSICPAFEKDSSAVIEFSFKTKAELTAASNCAADLLLFLQDNLQVMEDYSNCFDRQELIDGEWEETEE